MIIDQNFIENRPLSKTSLLKFGKSPRHYIDYLTQPKEAKDSYRMGNALDVRMLTPELFSKKFEVLKQKPNLRTKDGKAEMQAFYEKLALNKMSFVTADELKIIDTGICSVRDTEETAIYIQKIMNVQKRLKWTDKKTNIPLIGYIDYETEVTGDSFIVDVKSTKSADPSDFVRDIYKFGYHIQAAAYLDAYHKKYFKFPYFINLCIELEEPFTPSIMFYESKTIQEAKDEFHGLLQAFRYCMDKQLFHTGYEFRLMQQGSYFPVRRPGYYKPVFTLEDK